MGIDDLGKQAGDLAGKAGEFLSQNADKVQEVLKSEQAEGVSDSVLDKVADFADKVTGGKHSEQIADVRDKIDGAIGNE